MSEPIPEDVKVLVSDCLSCERFRAVFAADLGDDDRDQVELCRWPRCDLQAEPGNTASLDDRGSAAIIGREGEPIVLVLFNSSDKPIAIEGQTFARAAWDAQKRLLNHRQRGVDDEASLCLVRLPAGTLVLATRRDEKLEHLTPILPQPETPQRRVYRAASRLAHIHKIRDERKQSASAPTRNSKHDDFSL